VKRAAVVAVAVAALAAVAPSGAGAAAKRGYVYDLTTAKGFERLTFSGDPSANCMDFGTCGYSGVVTYTIAGKPKGTIALTRSHSGKVSGRARYTTNGTTVADVTPAGSRPNCNDSVQHSRDVWSIASTGANSRNLVVTYHDGATTDYLATNCAGPTEADVRSSGALPSGRFAAKDFFRGPKPSFSIAGGTPFAAAGFNASIEWQLSFKAKQRNCSPRCKLPR
jgi:hypothetical protein